jgi:spore maturation protein SpmA
MLNHIWAAILLGGLLVAGLLGRLQGDGSVVSAALEMASGAVMKIALPLAGMIMFWLGLMRLMEKAGLLAAFARGLAPLMRRLFPDVPEGHPALSSMIMNIAANMLGLGNAATPLGLKAMGHLQELNPRKHTASNAMVTFLAVNTAAFTLMPMTAIGYLTAAGIKEAPRIIVPTILATACTMVTALLIARSLQGLRWFRLSASPGPDAAQTADGEKTAGGGGDSAKETIPAMTRRGRWLVTVLLVLFAGVAVLELAGPGPRERVLETTGVADALSAAETRAAASQASAATASGEEGASADDGGIRRILNAVSALAIPLVLVLAVGVALARGVKVYEEFVEGAKEGFAVVTRIMPFLVAMFAALAIFRHSGALLLLEYFLSPLLSLLGFPPELLPMALMRPLSGSGSLAVMNELLLRPEAAEGLKLTAAVMFGSTETTFYVLAVYFGSVGVTNIRHALVAGLSADVVGLMMSVVIGRLMFGGF